MTSKHGKLAILVGGGPAPGINSVIATATIRAILEGYEVVGVHEGFRDLMRGLTATVEPLTIDTVSRIHFRGGSMLGTARDNPTTDPKLTQKTLETLSHLGVDKLITIGGDDTAFSAMTLQKAAGDKLRVVHVPKTIDNDLDLPRGTNTFGYQTARHVGVGLVKNLMIDARTTLRWFLVVSMGRKAGHLALGIGKAVGATVTIIPEEFPPGPIKLRNIVDIITGTVIRRLLDGRRDGVAVLAEGLMERLDPADLEGLSTAGRDEHGHIRLAEIDFGTTLKKALMARFAELKLPTKIVTKDIGYELRCADPIPYDMEYTRDLGFCAAQFIINGGTGAMIATPHGHFTPMFFEDMLDPETNRTRVRMVDIESEYYYVARRYMLRLRNGDFRNKAELARLAGVVGMTPQQFKDEFYYTIENDLLFKQHEDKTAPDSMIDVKAPF